MTDGVLIAIIVVVIVLQIVVGILETVTYLKMLERIEILEFLNDIPDELEFDPERDTLVVEFSTPISPEDGERSRKQLEEISTGTIVKATVISGGTLRVLRRPRIEVAE